MGFFAGDIPAEKEQQRRLSNYLEFSDYIKFQDQLFKIQNNVRNIFNNILCTIIRYTFTVSLLFAVCCRGGV